MEGYLLIFTGCYFKRLQVLSNYSLHSVFMSFRPNKLTCQQYKLPVDNKYRGVLMNRVHILVGTAPAGERSVFLQQKEIINSRVGWCDALVS
jgi:hypothetical protein